MSSFSGTNVPSTKNSKPKKKPAKRMKIAAERPYLKLVHCVRVPH